MEARLPHPPIVMSHQELTALMPFGDYVDAVADAFRMQAEGRAVLAPPRHIPAEGAWAFITKRVAAIVERVEST